MYRKFSVMYRVNRLGLEKHLRIDLSGESLAAVAEKVTPKPGSEWYTVNDIGVSAHIFPVKDILDIAISEMSRD